MKTSPLHPTNRRKAQRALHKELYRRYRQEKIAQYKAWTPPLRCLIEDLIDETARHMTKYKLVGFNRVIYTVDEFETVWNLLLEANPEIKSELNLSIAAEPPNNNL